MRVAGLGAANWGGAMRAYFGDRVGARKVLSSLGKDYILPPFFTTTETASAVVDAKGGRTFGHYLTNCAHPRSRLCNMRRWQLSRTRSVSRRRQPLGH